MGKAKSAGPAAIVAPAVDLANTEPIDPKDPALALLMADTQGNILKGHGREHTVHIFLQFKPNQLAGIKTLLRVFIDDFLTSAQEQLEETRDFKKFGITGAVFGNFFLTKAGYDALQLAPVPSDASFQGGMKAATLNDPAVGTWDAGYQQSLHAMLLVADDDRNYLHTKARDLIVAWRKVATVLAVESGDAMRNKNDDHIEHFGYVDGRSQPLFFTGDVDRERDKNDGISVWNPKAPLNLALVADPGATKGGFGSYFVFRKLEQNVRGFKAHEEQLAAALGLTGDEAERAGALVVGRFEDGTPITQQFAEGAHNPVPNNFDYAGDPDGRRCPFHAHIRKTNPRGDTVALGATMEDERSRRIVRRGITYGVRAVHPDDHLTPEDLPTDGVGLLFMCFQADIAHQFEFMQRSWANNPNFARPGSGLDPVIGQGPAVEQPWPPEWGGDKPPVKFTFQDFITMKGGEYFFAPAISTLESFA